MSIDELMRTGYPYLLAKRFEAVQLQEVPQLKIIEFVNLFEDTLKHITLLGLSFYNHLELNDDNVHAHQQDLIRPSLGHWLQLFRSIQESLSQYEDRFPLPTPSTFFKDGPIYDAVNTLHGLLGKEKLGKVSLKQFLEIIVTFRNKKIGHGNLTEWEAKQTLDPIERGILAWLEILTILQYRPLISIYQVEWTGYNFLFKAHKLNNGTSLIPINLESDKQIFPGRVYFSEDKEFESGNFISLFPFFHYDKPTQSLYIYSELTDNKYPQLQCFYSQIPEKLNYVLDADTELILGKEFVLR